MAAGKTALGLLGQGLGRDGLSETRPMEAGLKANMWKLSQQVRLNRNQKTPRSASSGACLHVL